MTTETDEATKAAMLKLAAIVKEVRRHYPRMDMSQFQVFLLAMTNPGINMADLIAPTALSKQAVSRNVRALSPKTYLADQDGENRDGYDLIVQRDDSRDSRAKIVEPTQRGRQLAERLADILAD